MIPAGVGALLDALEALEQGPSGDFSGLRAAVAEARSALAKEQNRACLSKIGRALKLAAEGFRRVERSPAAQATANDPLTAECRELLNRLEALGESSAVARGLESLRLATERLTASTEDGRHQLVTLVRYLRYKVGLVAQDVEQSSRALHEPRSPGEAA